MTQTSTSDMRLSVLALVQDFLTDQALTTHTSTHRFASNPEDAFSFLNRVVEGSERMSQSLSSHLSLPAANPKLLSLYRQHATISYSLHLSETNVQVSVEALRKRVDTSYGEEIPLEDAAIVDWCVSRLEGWGSSAGMETFKEEEREGRMTIVLGGKVLVIDIDLSVDRPDGGRPKLAVANLRTSYAIPNGASGSTTQGSLSLDGYLAGRLQEFLLEVQKEPEVQDTVEAARRGAVFTDSLKYLMRLDQLALSEGDGGLRWFSDVDALALETERFALSEAQSMTSSQPGVCAPLDILLMRGHSLPLPYLNTPSMSFLVYMAPAAYLNILRLSPATGISPSQTSTLPNLDIPFNVIRPHLATHPRRKGVTIASLVLSMSGYPGSDADTMNFSALNSRPTFTLVPRGAQINHVLPQVIHIPGTTTTPAPPIWVLDFTDGGKYPGVVMSQSRMREIELLLNPLSGMDNLNSVPQMAFGMGSWLDILLSPHNPISPERYTASYVSPNAVHPPLQLRLTAPQEPGFVLERVPVKNLREVWGILEIVKEQCWLNETLSAYEWIPEGLTFGYAHEEAEDEEATEEDLHAILQGTLTPRRIPVNVYISSTTSAPLFDPSDLGSVAQPNHARITMSSPEPPPMHGQVEISVTFDTTKPRGVALEVSGAMGADLQIDVLEEACRRGGILGLPGRIWAKSHFAS